MMKALVWEAPQKMVMREQNIPEPLANEVLIKVAYAGICGSELSAYLGHNALRKPPLIMGHEFSGEIVSLGDDATTINAVLQKGQRVTVNPLSCKETGSIFQQQGLDHLCASRVLLGAHRPGAYAEYLCAPAQSVLPLPDHVSLQQGALTEPVGCAVRIGELAGSVKDKNCLVIGAGPIGLLAMQVLLLNGAKRVFIADLDLERLAMGKAFGGDTINPKAHNTVDLVQEATGGLGVSVSVDAVGTAQTRAQCISATMPTGTMILSGLHEETSAIPVADVIRREIVLKGSFAYAPANFVRALELLSQNAIRLDPWIIEAPLPEGGPWFERLLAAPGNVAKVLLKPS